MTRCACACACLLCLRTLAHALTCARAATHTCAISRNTQTHTYHARAPPQVSWQEVCALIEWLLGHVRSVDVQAGDTQCFYVDLGCHVYAALRVPHLELQSPRCVRAWW